MADPIRARALVVDNDGLARAIVYAVRAAADAYRGRIRNIHPQLLHQFVRHRIRYNADTDPERQLLRMPWATLRDGVTDCKSSAIFIGGLSLAQGHQVTVRLIDEHGQGAWSHVYVLVDGVPADPLVPYGVAPAAKRWADVSIAQNGAPGWEPDAHEDARDRAS